MGDDRQVGGTLVVLGDSIAWGEGLEPDDKFWARVEAWARPRLGLLGPAQVLAHSLAVITPDPARDAREPWWGEIRTRYPSVSRQVELVTQAEAVRLVLLTGGINDVGAHNLVSPLTRESWLEDQAEIYCGRRMKDLLVGILRRCPRAFVGVAGYFPIFSEQSTLLGLERFIPLPWDHLGRLSRAWDAASAKWLAWAVREANAVAGSPRVVFAHPGFGPEHCYGAPHTRLWTLEEAIGDQSALAWRRRGECVRRKPWDPLCPIDPTAHPNREGALAYAAALEEALGRVLPPA